MNAGFGLASLRVFGMGADKYGIYKIRSGGTVHEHSGARSGPRCVHLSNAIKRLLCIHTLRRYGTENVDGLSTQQCSRRAKLHQVGSKDYCADRHNNPS
jgi:hypothetical protein